MEVAEARAELEARPDRQRRHERVAVEARIAEAREQWMRPMPLDASTRSGPRTAHRRFRARGDHVLTVAKRGLAKKDMFGRKGHFRAGSIPAAARRTAGAALHHRSRIARGLPDCIAPRTEFAARADHALEAAKRDPSRKGTFGRKGHFRRGKGIGTAAPARTGDLLSHSQAL
jgi:hypothetical protein